MTLAPLTSARTFRSISEHRNYRLWFIGQVTSMTGTWVQNVGQAWFIVALTHSAVALGLLAAAQFGPYGLLGLFGGTFADRLDRRRTLIGTQVALMGSAGVLAVLALTGTAQPWHVYVLACFTGTVMILDTPARQAFTIEMVGRDELPNAVALNSSLFNASRVVGPALGGVIIAAAGVGICFLVNALSFVAVLVALLMMDTRELQIPARAASRSLLRETGEGLAYAWRTPAIRLYTGMMLIIATVAMNFNVLLPVLAQRTLHSGPATFGLLSAAFGVGALCGALISATLGRASRRILFGGAIAYGVTQILIAPITDVALCAIALAANGVAFSLYASMSNAAVQLVVEDRLRGRIMAIYAFVFFGTAPIGGLLTGVLTQWGGTRVAFLVAGVTACIVGVTGALYARHRLRVRARGRVDMSLAEADVARAEVRSG